MSSLPQSATAPQAGVLYRRALTLAQQVTPLQRQLLVRTGMARWLRLPHPFQPAPGRQTAAVRALCSPEFGLLAPLSTYVGAYQLTPLGELVAGIWLLAALTLP